MGRPIEEGGNLNGFCAKIKGVVTEYTEYQAFSPVVRISSAPPPNPQASAASPPLWFQGSWGDTLTEGEGTGGANADEGTDTLVL